MADTAARGSSPTRPRQNVIPRATNASITPENSQVTMARTCAEVSTSVDTQSNYPLQG